MKSSVALRLDFKKDRLILDYNRNDYVDVRAVLPELVSYLKRKYNTRITLATRNKVFLDFPGWESGVSETDATDDFIFFRDHYFAEVQKIKGDYREAFIFGKPHAVLLVYVKEKGREVFLLMDSKGSSETGIVERNTGVKTYTLITGRQVDLWSCYVDALVIGRDITARDAHTGLYKISDLLTKLNLCDYGMHSIDQLPDELLKTAQRKLFLQDYRSSIRDTVIHKTETLDAFRARYTDKNLRYRKHCSEPEKIGDVSNYIRKKSIKYANVAEIQGFIDQIEKEVGRELTQVEWKEFRDCAKKEFKKQDDFFLKILVRKEIAKLANDFAAELDMPELIEDVSDRQESVKINHKRKAWSYIDRNSDAPVLLFDITRNSKKGSLVKQANETSDRHCEEPRTKKACMSLPQYALGRRSSR